MAVSVDEKLIAAFFDGFNAGVESTKEECKVDQAWLDSNTRKYLLEEDDGGDNSP